MSLLIRYTLDNFPGHCFAKSASVMALLGSNERLGAGRSLCSVMTEHDNNTSSSETRLRMRETAHHVISLIQVNISGHIRN